MELAAQNDNHDTVHEDEDFWMKHFQEFQCSNLSKSKYARQNNLVGHRFFYWCKKLEKGMSAYKSATKSNQSQGSDFVPIKIVTDEPKLNADVLCTIDLGSATRLYIHTEAAIASVIKLLLR